MQANHNPHNADCQRRLAMVQHGFGDSTLMVSNKLRKRLRFFGVLTETAEGKHHCLVCRHYKPSQNRALSTVALRLHLQDLQHQTRLNMFLGTHRPSRAKPLRLQAYRPLTQPMSCLLSQEVVFLTDQMHERNLRVLEGDSEHVSICVILPARSCGILSSVFSWSYLVSPRLISYVYLC